MAGAFGEFARLCAGVDRCDAAEGSKSGALRSLRVAAESDDACPCGDAHVAVDRDSLPRKTAHMHAHG
jgi:hypothetical protein